jgi:PAS domain S-box-containing protein
VIDRDYQCRLHPFAGGGVKFALERKILLGFGSALLLLLAAGASAWINARRADRIFLSVDRTHQVINRLEHVLTDVLTMQASTRGFVLSGNADQLRTIPVSAAHLGETLRELRELTADNPAQQRRLDELEPLIGKIRQVMDEGIARRHSTSAADPTSDDVRGSGQRLVDESHNLVRAMEAEENALLAQRFDRARTTARFAANMTGVATALAAAFVIGAAGLTQRDVSRRKAAENAAQINAARFADLYQGAPCGYHSLDEHGTVVEINDTELRWLGYSREEVIGRMHVTQFMSSASAERFAERFPVFIQDGVIRDLELEWRRKDGTTFPVLVTATASYDSNGIFTTSRTTVYDLTERQQVESANRRSEEQIRQMFEGVKDYAIIMLDPAGHVVSWNPAAAKIKGYSREEIIGQHFNRFYPPDVAQSGFPERELEQAAKTGRFEDEGWRVRKDGTRFWANVVMTALRDQTGTLRGFVKVTRDLTEHREAEQRIEVLNAALRRRANELEVANRELEAFSYSVSHDLRAPLRHIDGFAGLLVGRAGEQLDPECQRYVATISRSAKQMGTLIDDLLAFSRIGRAPLRDEMVNHQDLVTRVVAEGGHGASGGKITWDIGTLPPTRGDPAMLRQVWTNLIDNAVKYSRKSAAPQIAIGGTPDAEKGETVFFVRDNGVGFDMAYADKLFGVFQRLHDAADFEGTGIGLANVRRIVSRHGGRTWAEAAIGKGATFYFSLPVTPSVHPTPT